MYQVPGTSYRVSRAGCSVQALLDVVFNGCELWRACNMRRGRELLGVGLSYPLPLSRIMQYHGINSRSTSLQYVRTIRKAVELGVVHSEKLES